MEMYLLPIAALVAALALFIVGLIQKDSRGKPCLMLLGVLGLFALFASGALYYSTLASTALVFHSFESNDPTELAQTISRKIRWIGGTSRSACVFLGMASFLGIIRAFTVQNQD